MSLSSAVTDRVAAAKLWLVSAGRRAGPGQPRELSYLAHALYALVTVPSTEIETMTCDEHWRLYVNVAWLTDASVPDVAAEMAHLTWHLLYDHAGRARSLGVDATTSAAWHTASDLAIEQVLQPDALIPEGFPSAAASRLPPGRSAEEYFAVLSGLPVASSQFPTEANQEPDAACGSCCDGLSRTTELPPGLDFGGVDENDGQHIRCTVAIAYRQHVTGRGEQPGDAWRWANEVLNPTIAWEPLLASTVRRAVAWTNGNTHYTYSRRSRRQSALPRIVLPGTRRPVPNVAVVVDTSGSVDDALLGRAMGEVDGALRGLGVVGTSITVLACDAAVQSVSSVRSVRDVRLAGGGGTDMRAGLAAAEALRPRVDVVVVLTDGYTPWPPKPPAGAAVIAALLGRREHPFPPTPGWTRRVECALS